MKSHTFVNNTDRSYAHLTQFLQNASRNCCKISQSECWHWYCSHTGYLWPHCLLNKFSSFRVVFISCYHASSASFNILCVTSCFLHHPCNQFCVLSILWSKFLGWFVFSQLETVLSVPLGFFHTLFSSVQFSHSVVSDSLWPHELQHTRPPITSSQSPPKPMSIESVMPSNHLILYHPLLLLPSVFPSIRVFSKESVLHIRWPRYWSFSFSISPSNEHPGLISFRMDWLDLLAVQGTLKSLLQHHSSKESIPFFRINNN